ncbi:MAG TPA: Asp-tRNA(Asn)/Glu-tRNA(Gln) amidotransferase subunit GatB [Chloroflexia bacterium]|nr:Asp-tRNA(Asn)/Glu-tRNA(Gln) amidotransferase subunit GatB [Chloroflexia bacterium]
MVSTHHSTEAGTPLSDATNGSPGTEYTTTIGLEVHAQLLTESKMYCGCSADIAYAPPNSHVCPVCMGMPGTLPVINSQAVRKLVLTGLALNCSVPHFSKFDRKNYPYPDLMKGYQISQYDLPLCVEGYIEVDVPDDRGNAASSFRVGIRRVHLEEDTARLLHRTGPDGPYTLMDVNRAGVPLMEIVSDPDITSPEQAQFFAMKLRHLLRWLGVSTGNMEEGALRVDANVSVRPVGQAEFGTKVEVKNMNSFKALRAALEYEVERQTGVLRGGGRVVQETRGWVEGRNVTVSQRSKEEAHDYRYFPEPDLPPLTFTEADVDEFRAQLPELPDARRERLVRDYGLSPYDAAQLTTSPAIADYYEEAVKGLSSEGARAAAGLVVNDLARLASEAGVAVEESKLTPANLRELVELLTGGTINRSIARDLLPELFTGGASPTRLVSERGLGIMRDDSALEIAVDEAIAANPKAVADYLGGKESAIAAFLGPIMRATRGQADANAVRELLKHKLEALRNA